MLALDFSIVNSTPRDRYVHEAREALSALFVLGDLKLRSAWLYYGSINSASKVFSLTSAAYTRRCQMNMTRKKWLLDYPYYTGDHRRQFLYQRCRSQENSWWLHNYRTLAQVPEGERMVIEEGSSMILNLPDAERGGLFSSRGRPIVIGDKYEAMVHEWRARTPNPPAESAVKLVETYVEAARWNSDMRHFFECSAMQNTLRVAVEHREFMQKASEGSMVCSVACGILDDYELYRFQWAEIEKHAKVQRAIIKSKYQSFRTAVGERDGYHCACCGTEENPHLDHIIPVTRGGLSVIDNLQFLCTTCNNVKRRRVINYRQSNGR
jgi:hypothetical protein